jgi:cephalosporin hydroxylase
LILGQERSFPYPPPKRGGVSANDPKELDLIVAMGNDAAVVQTATDFIEKTAPYRYSYNFTWLGRPIIQYPQDVVAMQEIVYKTRPTLVVETGIAHGGSLILSASILELIGEGRVLGIDIDIREHNRLEIEKHAMSKRISTIQGSSVDPEIVAKVKQMAQGEPRVMVVLDSNHTHEHVLAELHAYAGLVTPGCYLIVCDTIVADMPAHFFPDRPWGKTNNPTTALQAFMAEGGGFELDPEYANKLLISSSARGYLRRV